MQIVIVGCGKVGSLLASVLIDRGHDIVIVESDSQLLENVESLDCIKITGVPIDRDVLRQAGIENADVLCTVTQNDNINIMVAQIAQTIFHVPRIITRVFNPHSRPVFENLGLDTVCSTELTVDAFLTQLDGEKPAGQQPVFGKTIQYSRTKLDEALHGTAIEDLASDSGKLIIGILRNGELLLAQPGIKVQPGDELILANAESGR
ncbi:MAG: TrkA family potassium uptake protein [Clostridiaceae bacterium]|jgi:trk system potassium uptake protein TrkA|nr:NAD-binding protein [Eubacteriales bacterium]NLV47035.1 TrkA family potassium uptake protein [Clostridiaceae bacterium]